MLASNRWASCKLAWRINVLAFYQLYSLGFDKFALGHMHEAGAHIECSMRAHIVVRVSVFILWDQRSTGHLHRVLASQAVIVALLLRHASTTFVNVREFEILFIGKLFLTTVAVVT